MRKQFEKLVLLATVMFGFATAPSASFLGAQTLVFRLHVTTHAIQHLDSNPSPEEVKDWSYDAHKPVNPF